MSKVRISDAVRTIKGVVPEAKTSEIERALRPSSRGGTVCAEAMRDVMEDFVKRVQDDAAEKENQKLLVHA